MVRRILGLAALIIGVLIVTGIVGNPFSLLSVFAPGTVQVGDTFQASVSSLNSEQNPSNFQSDVCFGSGVDTSIDPDVTLESGALSLQGRGDWKYTGGVVGWEYPVNVKAEQTSNTAVVGFTVTCLDGSTEVDSKFITIEAAPSDSVGGGDGGVVNVIEKRPPRVSVSGNTVTGRVTFENVGGSNMGSSHIVEMQVRPAGEGPLSFVSGEKVCDPAHPENVHKEFRLDSGDTGTITLSSEVGDGQYSVFFLTRDECAGNDGNTGVAPYPNAFSYGKVAVGEPVVERGFLALIVGGVLVIFGVGFLVFRRLS